MRWDPRLLVVDARESTSARSRPLDNPFFSWIRIRTHSQISSIASDVSQRHLVIVHEDEENALDLDHFFKALEIDSKALEGGERGWQDAVVEESAQMQGDALIVTMNHLAYNRRQYLIIHDRRAIAVQPSGSIAVIREEARHHGARIEAVVDVFDDAPSGESIANLLHVSYYRSNALHASGLDAWYMHLCGLDVDSLKTGRVQCRNF